MCECIAIQGEAREMKWESCEQEPCSFLPLCCWFPSPRQPLTCPLSLWITFSVLELHTTGVIQCVLFCILLLSLKKKKKSPNRIFHVICISSLFLFIAGKYFIVWLYQLCLFVHSFISWLTFELFPIFGYYVSGQTMQFLVWIYVSFSPLLLCYPLNLYPKSFSMASLRTFLHLHFLAASVASYWYFPFNLPTILILFKKKIKSNQTNNCFLTMTPHWR